MLFPSPRRADVVKDGGWYISFFLAVARSHRKGQGFHDLAFHALLSLRLVVIY